MRFRFRPLFVVLIAALLATSAACSKKDAGEKKKTSDRAVPVDPEAPAGVVAMIDAHGGMPGWRVAKTLSFENKFQMADDSVATTSRVTVDLARRRAYVDFGDGESMAWDGFRSWSVDWKQHYPVGLRAMLDCYMMNMPWLAMEPKVHVEPAGKDTLWDSSTQYNVIEVAPPAGPGAPYKLYVDPESRRIHAFVFRGDGGREIAVFGDLAKVGGMLLPTHYVIYSSDHRALASGTLTDLATGVPFDNSKMTPPPGAAVDQDAP